MQTHLHYVEYPNIDIQIKYPNKMVNADAPKKYKKAQSDRQVYKLTDQPIDRHGGLSSRVHEAKYQEG